ncbi:hypothetical protein V0R50_29445 [Pseudomonas sp. 148P]|uniref:Uncharacterized protein n=1 Tax=Pseudomonas ulcerans TaxID=3115852 RepID=A0ABU7I0Q2_9PSED|nr:MULTISPECIES: hypothetical protein [unclassified Pseudomonas]MEE1926472.1 hypothetical protein [Pseudomonas sp. 147P]MEE1937369.1 hypothetical protein [Pseudomonas sp. 148P]
MSKQNPQPRIGLGLSRTEMYPPLNGEERTIYVSTRIRDEAVQFDFTVNGESGSFPGIRLDRYFQAANLLIDKAFIASYSGTWPVQLKVRAWQDAFEESATLTLYDTRNMQAVRMEARLIPSDVAQIPPAGETTRVSVAATCYDGNGLELPYDEVPLQIEPNPPVAGVEVLGNRIFVSSMPHASQVHLRVSGAGASDDATLNLVK